MASPDEPSSSHGAPRRGRRSAVVMAAAVPLLLAGCGIRGAPHPVAPPPIPPEVTRGANEPGTRGPFGNPAPADAGSEAAPDAGTPDAGS